MKQQKTNQVSLKLVLSEADPIRGLFPDFAGLARPVLITMGQGSDKYKTKYKNI